MLGLVAGVGTGAGGIIGLVTGVGIAALGRAASGGLLRGSDRAVMALP